MLVAFGGRDHLPLHSIGSGKKKCCRSTSRRWLRRAWTLQAFSLTSLWTPEESWSAEHDGPWPLKLLHHQKAALETSS
ncbi:hypothetical protein Y1Q_0010048 [Alligator mississippiensis]|uniref:Uncharacterized protein n=1 Tax=Alligator mississippiensis TaxID=8496 RepID=A0A151MZ84_ALLMI|nr:hypothetical protein Y1Q_0010048 [Alligator mississippiensis]